MPSAITTCINNYNRLLNTEYVILIGRKNKTCELKIHFDKQDFLHLAGLHYLSDIRQLRGDREAKYNELLLGTIPAHTIESSIYYERIKARIEALSELPSLFESDTLIFRFNNSMSVFTKIRHDYLVEFIGYDIPRYLFLREYKDKSFHGVSFFPEETIDYTKGETRWTILKVSKTDLSSADSSPAVLYVNPSYKEDAL